MLLFELFQKVLDWFHLFLGVFFIPFRFLFETLIQLAFFVPCSIFITSSNNSFMLRWFAFPSLNKGNSLIVFLRLVVSRQKKRSMFVLCIQDIILNCFKMGHFILEATSKRWWFFQWLSFLNVLLNVFRKIIDFFDERSAWGLRPGWYILRVWFLFHKC